MISVATESEKIRELLESNNLTNLPIISAEFPRNTCKMVSILFCYHLYKIGYKNSLKCVFGRSKKRIGEVGHWWVELPDFLVDLTADQFNEINDSELSYKIKCHRPYDSVYCCVKDEAPHYKVFQIIKNEAFEFNIYELGEDYLEELEDTYNVLLTQL